MITPTLTLNVADAGSGVAAATVGGGTPGRTCQLFYAYRFAQVGPSAWSSGGTATFDGAGVAVVGATPGTGYGRYTWLAVQLDAGGTRVENFSPSYFRPLIDPVNRSVWERCVLATKETIDGLTLSGIGSSKIVAEWWPKILRVMNPAPPCVLVSPFASEEYPGGVNDQDDVSYPVVVVMVDAINQGGSTNMTRDLLWREQISRVFRFQRLAGVPEIYNTIPLPDVVVHPDAYANGLLVSTVLFRFVSRENRGQ